MNGSDVKLITFILLAAGLAVALWYFRTDILPQDQETLVIQLAPVEEEIPVASEPAHPLAPLASSRSSTGQLVPLPALDDSDAYFLLALSDIFGPEVADVLVSEALIDKFVATVDNLSREHVAEKVRPVDRLSGSFVADVSADNKEIYLSPDNYVRYDALVSLIAAADLDATAETYRRFYPLFQESYVRLGYPDAYFNDRVVDTIDHLLATPEPDEPVRLVRPHVLYEFAEPELEALSSGQKLLLRIGAENAATIKRVLGELRALVTLSADQSPRQ